MDRVDRVAVGVGMQRETAVTERGRLTLFCELWDERGAACSILGLPCDEKLKKLVVSEPFPAEHLVKEGRDGGRERGNQ